MQRLTHLVNQKRGKAKDNANTNNVSQSFLWSWGNLSSYIPARHKQRTPLLTESLDTQRIASITCDSRHIIVVTRDGIIFLWELGKSLKKISKKRRYSNYQSRPESLHKLVNMMRNQLPIVSNFEITQNAHKNATAISNDISFSLNKRIFYGSDAVKWLIDHEAVDDETESVRFCQALLNDGRMECANANMDQTKKNETTKFENNKSGLYYFSDSKKKTCTDYMQKFHAVPADPTLKFSIVASNQHYVYTITQNGQLFEWDLKQRSIYLKNNFIKLNKAEQKAQCPVEVEEEEYEYEEQSQSDSDPLDSSKGSKEITVIRKKAAMSLNGQSVDSFPTDSTDSDLKHNAHINHDRDHEFECELKHKLSREQANYAKYKNEQQRQAKSKKKKVQQTVKQIASKWIEPHEFFIGDQENSKEDDQESAHSHSLPEMLLLEKLSCRPTLIHSLPISSKCSMRYVSCGHDFVIVLSSNGELYSWGNGYHGKLGHGNQERYSRPHLVAYFAENEVIVNKIECGYDHSVCISNDGEMFAWGSNRNGKLGIGDANVNFATIPRKIRIVDEFYNNKFHFEYVPSVIMQVSADYNPSKARNNEHVKDIFETFLAKEVQSECQILSDIFVIEIACGFGHNLAVVAGTGQIYSWGANLCGQLGLNDQTDRYLPTLIQQYQHPVYKQQCVEEKGNNIQPKNGVIARPKNPFSAPPLPSCYIGKAVNVERGDGDGDVNEDNPAIGVGCGAFHSSALTMNGDVYCWGDNSEGQLGIGEMKYNESDDILTPQLVDYLSGIDTTNICCGADFTFAVTHNFIHYQNDYFHIKNEEKLNQRKLHYKPSKINKYLHKFRKNKLLKPQANRQAGLPAKIASERRKHQREIEKLQEIFKKNVVDNNRKKKENKKIEEKHNNNNIQKKSKLITNKKKKIIKAKNNSNNLEFEEKGYKESDMNRAVEYWCKIGLNDFDKQRNSPKLRESVWKVGIPTRLRGKVWPLAIGNQLNINKTLYKLVETRAKQINEKNMMIGRESSIKLISQDLSRTFSELSYFQKDGPLYESLHSLLETYCFFRPDRGYKQGTSYLAANLLLYMDSYNAFVCFANLLNQQFFHCLVSDLNAEKENIIPARIDIFNGLFQHNEAVLFERFKQQMIQPMEYFLDWVLSLFTKERGLSISVASRVWDIILIFGEMEIYRCCVAILRCLQRDLLFTDEDNIRKQLKSLPKKLKESQVIFAMKTIKVPKKLKQQLQKINSQSM